MTRTTLHRDGAVLRLSVDGSLIGWLEPGFLELDRRAVGGIAHVDGRAGLAVAGPIADGLEGAWDARVVGPGVWELTLVLRNTGSESLTVTRMDPCDLRLETDDSPWRTSWFRSAWGDEFRPEAGTTRHDIVLESRSGRSSHGTAPWLGLERAQGAGALIVTPAWSGNWHIHALSGGIITAGISPWRFAVELAPGDEVIAPSVVIAAGIDLDDASLALQRAVRDDWLPRTEFTDASPVEWNHWWPYEDAEVDESVIAANAAEAARAGIEIATVDAGWFGAADAASDWQEQRGDWHLVNTARFPSGLEALGDSIRAQGVLPGIWIEAEAVGRSALLRAEKPGLLAQTVEGTRHDPSYRLMTVSLDPDDPTFLGYVCLGSAEGREHVLSSMTALIERTGARWIKLDFNIDPDAGCTRTDHGHGAGDGLFRHYEGLYAVLDAVRGRHPEIVLESCSSGGLRIDLGLARHVHGFFLSDPDYTEHHLEVLAGATRMLPPLGILHWSQSQWRGDYPPQRLDWAALADEDFDTMLRAAMLHRFGVSLRLTELRPSLIDRLHAHVDLYRRVFAPMMPQGVLRAHTAPPQRGGLGERVPVFQLSADDTDRHIVAAFVLAGGTAPTSAPVSGLDVDRYYELVDLGSEETSIVRGAELLAEGIPLRASGQVTSWLIELRPLTPQA